MRSRIALLAAVPLLLLPLLTACDPGAGPGPAEPAPDVPAEPEPAAPIVALPEDAVMSVTAAATASNGAVLDISLIVHSPNPFSADGAADDWAATTAWCVGEIDDSIIADQGYSFTTVDVTATTREGDWPADTPLLLAPLPYFDATLATGGDLVQTNQPSLPGQVAGSVPHCAQPALLLGPGSGQLFVGIPGDVDGDASGTPPLGGWANRKYGVNTHVPGEDQAANVTFGECTVEITDLGASLGAPTASWQQAFQSDFCIVGGDSVGIDAS
jgi:hypothetical protein